MVVIGLTGGIGSGKSEVARILRDLGAVVIDADKVGHEVYRPHTDGWRAVVEAFGEGILQPSGEVDRKKLGSLVFSDRSQLERLNRILHPRMLAVMRQRLDELREQNVPVAVVEAAILLEAGWDCLADEVWVTTAEEDIAVRRVVERGGVSEEDVRARVRAQMPSKERQKYATVVIDNNGNREALRRQVEAHWHRLMRRERGG